jgi:hypothetical protein
MRLSLLLLPLAACSGSGTGITEDDSASGEFCSSLADGGTFEVRPEGGNATSGNLEIRVLTSESEDPMDPVYVAFKSYTLENIDSGGVKTIGQTSGDGLVDELLGAGNWRFSAAYTRGSLTCLAEIDLPIQANSTTWGCPVMQCP